jgi:hypothetical protein
VADREIDRTSDEAQLADGLVPSLGERDVAAGRDSDPRRKTTSVKSPDPSACSVIAPAASSR